MEKLARQSPNQTPALIFYHGFHGFDLDKTNTRDLPNLRLK